eukprot:Skav232617  [mRNA]  locus=scaffold1260:12482:32717:+ [translate_table: standard]
MRSPKTTAAEVAEAAQKRLLDGLGVETPTTGTPSGQGGNLLKGIGDSVQHKPIKTFLMEEGLLPSEDRGVAWWWGGSWNFHIETCRDIGTNQGVLPFGLGRPVPPVVTPLPAPDPQTLISKRVEAATRAADVAKQVLRRQIDFEDEEMLRKLVLKGVKSDKQWAAAYQALSAAIELSAATSPRLLGLVLMSTSSRVSSRARDIWRQSAQEALERGDEVAAKVQVMVAESQAIPVDALPRCVARVDPPGRCGSADAVESWADLKRTAAAWRVEGFQAADGGWWVGWMDGWMDGWLLDWLVD